MPTRRSGVSLSGTGIVAGAALASLLLGLVARIAKDDPASKCLVMVSVLNLPAGYTAVRVLPA